MIARSLGRFCFAVFLTGWLTGALSAAAQRQMEELGRGVVAVPRDDGGVLISWRLLATDPSEVAFDVYRSVDEDAPIRLNSSPVHQSTN
jgi:rhamnogalacturonan endolyase